MKSHFVALIMCFCCLNGSLAADATEPPFEKEAPRIRGSRIELSTSTSRDEFRATNFTANLGLNSVWLLEAGIGSEKSAGIRSAQSFYLGADARLNENFSANFSLQSRREPDAVVARGISTGLDWTFSSLWEGEFHSAVSLQGTFLRYKQDEGSQTRVSDGGIQHNSLTVGLSQEFTESFSIAASATGYGFGGASADELSTAISSRPNTTPEFMSVLEGFPRRAYSLSPAWSPIEALSFEVSLFKVDYASGAESRGLGLSTYVDLNANWNVGIGVSGTRMDNGSKSGLFDLSAAHRW